MDDKRLERLYDYTKWHIGIYLSVAGGLTAAVGYLAESTAATALAPFVDKPALLLSSVILMFLAGVCGAVVASSCTECVTYEDLWLRKQGPFGLKLLLGRQWAALEHFFFWLSVLAATTSILTSAPVLAWLGR